ncbi:MAG: hypothetical protein LBR61_06240 [Synergistaceae bacterium]|jgi:hypothetical protein|nr:hypothetical protein [Synergistaceae bacterium]
MDDTVTGVFFCAGMMGSSIPFAAGGFCQSGTERLCEEEMRRLEHLNLSSCRDLFLLDKKAAEAVQERAKSFIYAVGITFRHPEICASTGGVLGNPNREGRSSEGTTEDIGNGFSMFSHPGGPGVVIRGDAETLEPLARMSFNGLKGGKKAEIAEAVLRENAVEVYMILTDGTGPDAEGILRIRAGRRNIRYRLP